MAAFAVLAVSCQKENNEVEPNTKETIEISINGLMGEYTQVDATKASLVNTVRVSWEGDETVFVFDGTECLGSLVASLDGTEDRYALLSTDTEHTVKAPATGTTKLTLVYSPLLTEAPAVSDGAISISMAEQNSTKAPFVVYASLDYVEGQTSIEDLLVPFYFATSVIRVSCTGLSASTDIDKAEVSNVNTSCVLSFANGSVAVSGADNGSITRLMADGFDNVNIEGDASFQFAVPVLSTATGRTLTVNQGGIEHIDENFSKASINPNLSVNTICTMRDKDSITPDSPIGTIGTIGGRKAMVVNLYGAKYAVALRNEGATADSGTGSYGGYYSYDEASAFFHNSALNVWRVPTMDEMKALTDMSREYDSTTPALKFKTVGGSITFPLAGLCTSEGVSEIGHVYYYTSTLLESEGDMVCFMDYRDGAPYVEYISNATDLFKLPLRLFYQLTETNTDVLYGRFTVNADGKQVYFSKGNLYYDGSALNFEASQYATPSGWDATHVSHFTWSSTVADAVGESNSGDNLFCDENHKVSVNGSEAIYYSLSTEEWQYLFNNHSYKWATVNGVNGYVIAPDGFTGPLAASYADDAALAADNLVFLPAAGFRYGSHVYGVGGNGRYWSSTASDGGRAYCVYFDGGKVNPDFGDLRSIGCSVRLITDVK